jgi:hypothetical protein
LNTSALEQPLLPAQQQQQPPAAAAAALTIPAMLIMLLAAALELAVPEGLRGAVLGPVVGQLWDPWGQVCMRPSCGRCRPRRRAGWLLLELPAAATVAQQQQQQQQQVVVV